MHVCVCVWVSKRVWSVCVAYAALLIFIFARFTSALLHLFALSLTAVATHIFFSALFWALSVAFNWYTCFFARQRSAAVCASECVCVLFKIATTQHTLPRHTHTATLYAVVHLKNATVNAFSFAALALPTPLTTTHL